MKRFIWTQYLRNLVSNRATRSKRLTPRRITIETLEDRLAPALYVWSGNGPDNRWSTGANWVGGVAPTGSVVALDSLEFPSSATVFNAVNDLTLPGSAVPTFKSIVISGNNYALSGNALTLGDPSDTSSGSIIVNSGVVGANLQFSINIGGAGGSKQFITVGDAATLTISGQLTGTTGVELTKQGIGTLILSANNSGFTGPISIDNTGGILQIRHAQALGSTSSPTRVGTNAQLQVSNVAGTILEPLILNGPGVSNDGAILNVAGTNVWGGTVALDSNSTFGANAGSIQFTNVISDLGPGYSITKEGTAPVLFAGSNTYRGLTTINNGTLVIQNPLALGAGGADSNRTIVNETLTKVGQLQIDDPTGVGFTVFNERLELNGEGVDIYSVGQGAGALHNLRGNNTWAGSVLLRSPAPNGVDVRMGVASGTQLIISGVISGQTIVLDPQYTLTKVDLGKLIFNNSNTFASGPLGATFFTIVAQGTLNIRDSQALSGSSVGVASGAALEYEVDTGFDAHGRNLGNDSVTGASNRLQVSNILGLQGTGVGGTGALRSISGINVHTGQIRLDSTAAIGVEPDLFASNTNSYFTSDYSLTVTGEIMDANGPATLIKVGTGQLILPNANTYTNQTQIQQGWVTIRNAGAFGPLGVGSDTVQPGVIVSAGASLHFKPFNNQHIHLVKPLTLSGTGITHPFALINQKGALLSLGGDNSIGGSNTTRKSDIRLNGTVGIGVELPDPIVSPTSSLTITSSISNGASAGGITKFGSRRLILQGDGTYTGANTVSEGVLRVRHSQALGVSSTGTANAANANTYTTTTTTVSRGIAELQRLRIVGTAGTYRLNLGGQITDPISTSATPAQVAAALNALPVVVNSNGLISVTQSGNTYMVSFGGGMTGDNQPQLAIASGSYSPASVSVLIDTIMNGDGAAIELDSSVDWLNGGISTGMNIWYERLVLNSRGNSTFAAAPLTTLANDNMWRGPVTLTDNSTILVHPSTRLTIFGTIDDATNTNPSGSSLSFTGGGKIALGGSNSYRGTTFVNQGTLIVENSQALGGAGVAQVQEVVLGGANDGEFRLGFKLGLITHWTDWMPANALAALVQAELNALPSIQGVGGFVTVSRNMNVYTVTFFGSFLGFAQSDLDSEGRNETTVSTSTNTQGAGGTIVNDGAAIELMGNLAIAGEPLIVQGRGNPDQTNVPVGWFQEGPAPANNWPGAGNQAVSGRITGVVVDPSDNNVIYVSTAAGGVWKSKNGGLSWLPLFDRQLGNSEVQTVTINGTSGTFQLGLYGVYTGDLPWNATAEQVQIALNNLSTIGGEDGSVSVTRSSTGNSFIVTFGGQLRGLNLPLMDFVNGGANPSVVETNTGRPTDLPMYIGTIMGRTSDLNGDTRPDVLDAIYIGTGETNNSPDSYYGTGIYRSVDAGVNWTLVAGEQHQIVTVTGTDSAGSFTLDLEGEVTDAIDIAATPADLETAVTDALNNLPSMVSTGSTANVIVTRRAEVQRVTVTATSGNIDWSFNGGAAVSLAYNASAATVKAALDAMPTMTAAGLTATVTLAGAVYTITFNYSATSTVYDVVPLTVTFANVTESTAGAALLDISWAGPYSQRELPLMVALGTNIPDPTVAFNALYNPFVGKGISKIIVDTRMNDTVYAAVGDGGNGVNEVQQIRPFLTNDTNFTLRFTQDLRIAESLEYQPLRISSRIFVSSVAS